VALPESAPKLGYAFYDDEAVLVLIRVDHAVLLDPQRQAVDSAPPPLSDGPAPIPVLTGQVGTGGAGPSADGAKTSAPLSPSSGKSPVFDGFVAKCAIHQVCTTSRAIKESFHRGAGIMLSATAQPAGNSGGPHSRSGQEGRRGICSFSPQRGVLCDQLNSLDRMLDSSAKTLALPLQYRQGIQKDLVGVLKGAGLPANLLEAIPKMFPGLESVGTAMGKARTQLKMAQTEAQKVTTAYRGLLTKAAKVCSPTGPAVTSLVTLITPLQVRIDGAALSCTMLATACRDVFTNSVAMSTSSATDAQNLLARLDDTCENKLSPLPNPL
jgi:hypothetical protein